MAKFPEASARILGSVFVCRKCKTKIKAPNMKVIEGRIKCRRCNSKALRPVRKK